MTTPTTAVTYVCAQKDIVCGHMPENWCDTCPLKAKGRTTEAEQLAQALNKEQLDTVRRDVLNHDAASLLRSQAAEIEALKAELAAIHAQPVVAWKYDWYAEDGAVTDWLTSNYDEAHSPTMGCHNIQPLITQPMGKL
jgi:hypothetical protein